MRARRTRENADPHDDRRQRVLAVVDSVPRGCVATYGQVAEEAGLPRRERLVGRLLSELADGSRIPWHRVVNASGRVSPRPRGTARQLRLLRAEGSLAPGQERVDLERHLWRPEGG